MVRPTDHPVSSTKQCPPGPVSPTPHPLLRVHRAQLPPPGQEQRWAAPQPECPPLMSPGDHSGRHCDPRDMWLPVPGCCTVWFWPCSPPLFAFFGVTQSSATCTSCIALLMLRQCLLRSQPCASQRGEHRKRCVTSSRPGSRASST